MRRPAPHVGSCLEVGIICSSRHTKPIAEYMAQAFAFDRFANTSANLAIKQSYADVAECYRILAKAHERLSKQSKKPAD
jgi:hypothetical protein